MNRVFHAIVVFTCTLGLGIHEYASVAEALTVKPPAFYKPNSVHLDWTKEGPLTFGYKVVEEITHNSRDFTEGFVYHLGTGQLVESVGLNRKSHISVYSTPKKDEKDLKTVGTAVNARSEFAEGITFFQDRETGKELLIQLTYRRKVAHIYEVKGNDIVKKETISMPTGIHEGWGITTAADRRILVMSDGSSVLHFMEKRSNALSIIKHVTVHDCANGFPEVKGINELELIPRYITHKKTRMHIRGSSPWWEEAVSQENQKEVEELIWANIIGTQCIAVINPDSGQVMAWINVKNLDSHYDPNRRVTNGIALRITDDTIWVTGKEWPKTYRIELEPLSDEKRNSFNIHAECTTHWYSPMTVGKEVPKCK